MLRRSFIVALVATPLAGCLPSPADDTLQPTEFVGRWIEVLLGGDGGGFELFANGTATSIDQPELNYVSWRVEHGNLFLTATQTTGNAIKTIEVEYSARFDDVNSLHLDQDGVDDWSRVFRMIN